MSVLGEVMSWAPVSCVIFWSNESEGWRMSGREEWSSDSLLMYFLLGSPRLQQHLRMMMKETRAQTRTTMMMARSQDWLSPLNI